MVKCDLVSDWDSLRGDSRFEESSLAGAKGTAQRKRRMNNLTFSAEVCPSSLGFQWANRCNCPRSNRMNPVALIIDDELQIRRLLRVVLEGANYQVREATTGQEGLLEAANRRRNVILLDSGYRTWMASLY